MYNDSTFGASNVQYNLRGLAVKSNFTGTGDAPKWEMIYGEWKKEEINSHSLSTNLSATIMDKTQTISFSAELPPRDESYSFSSSFSIWLASISASWQFGFPEVIENVTTDEGVIQITKKELKLDPFNASLVFNFPASYGSFRQNLAMDTEKKELTTLTSSLSLSKWGISATFNMSRTLGYRYNMTTRSWVSRQEKERTNVPVLDDDGNPVLDDDGNEIKIDVERDLGNLIVRPRDFSLSFSKSFKWDGLIKNKLNLTMNISSRLYLDLQRYTSSSLSFSLGFTVGIGKFLNLSMSTNSENTVIYRYFRKLFPDQGIDLGEDGPQNNFFLDLFNSFRFDNEELRRQSGFKMKSFRLSVTHLLGDWDATLNWSMAPYRSPITRRFEMNNEISFMIQWKPIGEIKSDINYNKRNTPAFTVQQ